MRRKKRASQSEQARPRWESSRSRTVSALTMVSNLVVGIFFLFESGGDLQKIGAIVLVAMGAAHSADLASEVTFWGHKEKKLRQNIKPATRDYFLILKKSRIEYRRRATRKPQKLIVDQEGSVFSANAPPLKAELSNYANLFYTGLLFGILGITLFAIGLGNSIYQVNLAGSILASIGFVAIACALVSAEDADEAA